MNEFKKDQLKNVQRTNSYSQLRYVLTPNDSSNASFVGLNLDYELQCFKRYSESSLKQRKQFVREIKRAEVLQEKALDCVRMHRLFVNPIFRKISPEELIQLTPSEQFRLDEILRS